MSQIALKAFYYSEIIFIFQHFLNITVEFLLTHNYWKKLIERYETVRSPKTKYLLAYCLMIYPCVIKLHQAEGNKYRTAQFVGEIEWMQLRWVPEQVSQAV